MRILSVVGARPQFVKLAPIAKAMDGRAEHVIVRALNTHGESFTLEADGLLAICIQHEMDHLKGKVFVEYLSPLKQSRLRAKLKKHRRETM